MTNNIKLAWIYSISALYLAMATVLILHNFLWFALLPLIILVVLIAFYAMDTLMFFVVFSTPLAINLIDLGFGFGLSLPTEPIMFGIMILFFFKIINEGGFDVKVLKHPISVVILLNLFWMFFTSVTSEMPLVSFKYVISRLWFVVVFYFLGTQLFRKFSNIKKFGWVYCIPFVIVIFYTLIRHAKFNFGSDPAHWVMSPFYNDHTAYGALLAMFFPMLIGYIINKKYNFSIKMSGFALLVIFIVAIIFSYARAAWISLAVALAYYILMLFRVRFTMVLLGLSLAAGTYILFQKEILMVLEENRQDTSQDFGEHIQSMSNITTDASNLERINRWNSALRMFSQRPIVGWGPGTYSFQYAPFQHSSEKTIISTNMGDMGNAHSEYIGPLAESGVLGTVTFLLIVFTVLFTGMRLYYTLEDKEVKLFVACILLGLLTYFVGGILNNFLDTDKASIPFWGFIAMLTAIDVYHKDKPKEDKLVDTTAE